MISWYGYYSRVATIQGGLLFKGGYYSRVATIKGVAFNQVNTVYTSSTTKFKLFIQHVFLTSHSIVRLSRWNYHIVGKFGREKVW